MTSLSTSCLEIKRQFALKAVSIISNTALNKTTIQTKPTIQLWDIQIASEAI